MEMIKNLLELTFLFAGTMVEAGLIWLAVAGWGLPFVLAIAGLSMKNLGKEYLLAAVILTGLGVINGYYAGLLFEVEAVEKATEALLPLIVFGTGPAIWLGLKAYLDLFFKIKLSYVLHFVPGAIASLYLGVYQFSSELGIWPFDFQADLGSTLSAGFIVSIAYAFACLKNFIKAYKEDSGDDKATTYRHTFLVLIGIALFLLTVPAFLVLIPQVISPAIPLWISAVLLIATVSAYCRYPDLFEMVLESIEAAPHRRTTLPDSIINHLREKLITLMENEKIYLRADISLPKMAEALDVTPHQLSEYLNFHVGSNFFRYVNGYRVDEVKRKLIEKPSKPIIEIAMEAGFNSKSVFNTAFSEIVGATPSAWRKSNKNK